MQVRLPSGKELAPNLSKMPKALTVLHRKASGRGPCVLELSQKGETKPRGAVCREQTCIGRQQDKLDDLIVLFHL